MNLFMKKVDLEIACFCDGTTFTIEEAEDEVFASKAMGDGFGIIPSTGIIYAPCTATVAAVFPTGHAIGFKMSDGTEILLHLGIDTVELEGKGFNCLVGLNDKVVRGQKVAEMDIDFIKSQGKSIQSFMIFTSGEKISLRKLHEVIDHEDADVFDFI